MYLNQQKKKIMQLAVEAGNSGISLYLLEERKIKRSFFGIRFQSLTVTLNVHSRRIFDKI